MITIPELTDEEIETLQVDACMRLTGQNTKLIIQLDRELGQALIAKGKADIEVATLKNQKQTLIELQRNLKTLSEKK